MDRLSLNGKSYILVPEEEFKLLVAGAPPLPSIASNGTVPAVAYARASIARDLVKLRRELGLSQKQLAELAGLRVEVLNRAERGLVSPSLKTLMKIEAVVDRQRKAQRRAGGQKSAATIKTSLRAARKIPA